MDKYIEVRATVRIPVQKIKDMIVAAVEGGSNCWAILKFPENCKSYSEIPFKNGNIEVYHAETGELLGYVNRATIQTGLQLMADKKDIKGKCIPARHFSNLAQDSEDTETADVFIQLAVMGEVVYG